jgi:uncharacterized protein YegP (UPF0339 family)
MTEHHVSAWYVERVGEAVVERLSALHSPNAEAVAKGVDLVGEPHREDDAGHNWTRLRFARSVSEVVPGSAVLLGSGIGTYLAKVVAWDFEVSDDDPIVLLELLDAVADANGAQPDSSYSTRFELYTDADGKYRFRLKSPNGEVVAVSEPYESRVAARAAIESIRSGASRSPVDELV